MEWSNEVIMEFLDLYEGEPVIWNPQIPDHKDRNQIYDAWKRIQNKISIDCSFKELKKKKENLMATYRKLTMKVINSTKNETGSNEVYKPEWFAYEKMASFLHTVYTPRGSKITDILPNKYLNSRATRDLPSHTPWDQGLSSTSPPQELSYTESDLIESTNLEIKSELDEEHELISFKPQTEMCNDIERTHSSSTPLSLNEQETHTAFYEPPKKRSKRKAEEEITLSDILAAIESTKTAQITTISQDVNWNIKDEIKVFCKYLGNRLNKLPDIKRDEFESQILKQLFELENSLHCD